MSIPESEITWNRLRPQDDGYRRSARYVADLMLAASDDELPEALALAAMSAISERDQLRDALRKTIIQIIKLDAEIDRLRQHSRRAAA